MAQHALFLLDGETLERDFPDADTVVTGNIRWGRFDAFLTPGFWANRCWMWSQRNEPDCHRLGNTLIEETAACLLGGHGIPAEVGVAAFRRLQASRLLEQKALTASEVADLLMPPLEMAGRLIRYRFVRQKASYLADMHRLFAMEDCPSGDLPLRHWLLRIRGVGPKTASWVVRNWRNSDNVAILDIHIYRAGLIAGFFPQTETPERHYFALEKRFLEFAGGLGVRPSVLDAVIWDTMRYMPITVEQALKDLHDESTVKSGPPVARLRNSHQPRRERA